MEELISRGGDFSPAMQGDILVFWRGEVREVPLRTPFIPPMVEVPP